MNTPTDLSKTSLRRLAQYHDRWSSYGDNTGIVAISDKPSAADLRQHEIFQPYDDAFLEKLSPDISIALWSPGSVLFEEGAYIDLAFFISKGEVEVNLEGVGASPIFDASRTSMVSAKKRSSEEGEGVSSPTVIGTTRIPNLSSTGSHEITFLASMDFNLPKGSMAVLGEGELFGEIGAMSGWPQSVTARTKTECQLIQIRVPALRLMKRRSKDLKERLDKLYKERALMVQLRSTPLFSELNDLYLSALMEATELVSLEPGEVLVQEGDLVDAVYMVRSGFVRLGQRFGSGDLAVTYLSKGMLLGEVEMLVEGLEFWETTATAVEYVELVKIPADAFRNMIQGVGGMDEKVWGSVVSRLKEIGARRRDISGAQFTQVALGTGLVQGNSILLIDVEQCTRCDDCVRACAATHEGRPRFVREGNKIERFQIARSCYHCRDPVCLVGCPTGAIHRAGVEAVVEVDDEICIGCGTCAGNCPYDAIIMHDTEETWPDDMIPTALRQQPRQVASKCDLCKDTGHGPACVSNCPQGCAFRVGSLDEIQELLQR